MSTSVALGHQTSYVPASTRHSNHRNSDTDIRVQKHILDFVGAHICLVLGVFWGVFQEQTGLGASFISCKLDGVGPIDNRPSTDKLHHFAFFLILFFTCDM